LVGFPFPTDDDYVTLAGLFYKKHGSVPKVGDAVKLDGGQFTVLEMDNHRITLLKFEDTAVGEDGVVRLVESSSAAGYQPSAGRRATLLMIVARRSPGGVAQASQPRSLGNGAVLQQRLPLGSGNQALSGTGRDPSVDRGLRPCQRTQSTE
jgi:hypothetical protein